MSRPLVVFASFVLIASGAIAQELGSNVTDAQLSAYQSQIDTGSRARGRERGDPAEKVDAFCSCMSRTLMQQVPRSDWAKAYAFAQQGRHTEELQAIAPYLGQLQACK